MIYFSYLGVIDVLKMALSDLIQKFPDGEKQFIEWMSIREIDMMAVMERLRE